MAVGSGSAFGVCAASASTTRFFGDERRKRFGDEVGLWPLAPTALRRASAAAWEERVRLPALRRKTQEKQLRVGRMMTFETPSPTTLP